MKYVDLIQGSDTWLQYRKCGIGASEVSAVLGISPFKSPFGLWEEKMYGTTVQINTSMKRGIDREKEGIEKAQDILGVIFEPKVVQHQNHMFLFASLDGITMEGDVAIEVKWANGVVHSLAKRGIVSEVYYPQCQAQLACTELKEMWFLSCFETPVDPAEYILVKVFRDDLFIEKMIEKCSEFYHENMLKGIAPPLTDKDYVKLEQDKALSFNILCDEYKNLTEQESMISERKKEIIECIKHSANGKSACSDLFKATKFKVKGSVQYDQIECLKEVNLDDYRKELRDQWKISKK